MADRFLLNGDICIYLLKGLSPPLSNRVHRHAEGSSPISLAETGVGVHRRPEEADAFTRFIGEVVVVPFDADAVWRQAALPLGRDKFDRLIVAHALALNLTLVTNNEGIFANIPGLCIENRTR